MMIPAQESGVSTGAIMSNFGPDLPLTHMSLQFRTHEKPIGVDAHWNLIGYRDTQMNRITGIDYIGWLICFLSKPYAGNINYGRNGADTSAFPVRLTNSIHPGSVPTTVDSSTYASMFMGLTALLAASLNPDLYDALRDLEEARIEAREEKFPIPSDIAIGNARRLLRAMYMILPRRFEVYPTPDGGIAIDVRGGQGYAALLLCESDGGVLCLVSMNGVHRRARYSDAHTLPDGFVREALLELEAREHAHV